MEFIKEFIKGSANFSNLKALMITMLICSWLGSREHVIRNTIVSGVAYILFCLILCLLFYIRDKKNEKNER